MTKANTIILLPDGETWNTIDGCSILVVSDKQFLSLCNDEIDARDLIPIVEISLSELTHGS